MKIAILGYGTIGSGVYKIIQQYKTKCIHDLEVVKVFDQPNNKNKLEIITSDIDDILGDSTIECIVETMGGIHPAYEFISAALANGKHVVTANKAVVAAYIKEFVTLANKHNVRFLFEATTGGGIPWLAGLNKAKRVDSINQFYGIFNGTSNYILDAMTKHKKTFDEVLRKTQVLGYAEADPSADIDGYDVQNKIVISSAVAFDSIVNMDDFLCYGIRNIKKEDIEYFEHKQYVIKYIGEAVKTQDTYEAFVMANAFDYDQVEANIGLNFNIVTLYGRSIDSLKFYGQGAGRLPTANAIVQDIVDIETLQTAYDFNLDVSLVYQAMQKNSYVLRYKDKIENNDIDYSNKFEDYYYNHTKEITADQLRSITNDLQLDQLFVVKIANYKG